MAEVNTQEQAVYKLVKTQAAVSSPHPDVFKIKIAQYQFSSSLTNLVLYDTDYALLVLGDRELGYIVTRGMAKTMRGEKYLDADIFARTATAGAVVQVEGYTTSHDK